MILGTKSDSIVRMDPTNRFLHRGGLPEERGLIAVLDTLIDITPTPSRSATTTIAFTEGLQQ